MPCVGLAKRPIREARGHGAIQLQRRDERVTRGREENALEVARGTERWGNQRRIVSSTKPMYPRKARCVVGTARS
jgi:hypothetical protein